MGRGNVEEEERLLEAVVGDTEIPEVKRCSPQTTTKIINRIRALCMRLLEIEVDTDELRSPTSRCVLRASTRKCAALFTRALRCRPVAVAAHTASASSITT